MIKVSDARTWSGSSTRWAEPFWVGLCCLGLLTPSSVGGVFSSRLSESVLVGMLAFGILLILISGRLSSRWGLILGLTIGSVPWLVSWVRMDDLGRGSGQMYTGALFLLLGLVFCLPMRMAPSHWIRRIVLPITEVGLAVCAVGVMAGVPAVGRFLVDTYSQYSPELVPIMLALHRPVGVFGTHSVAAFAYYLLLFLHLRFYEEQESPLHLWCASFWLVVIGALSSSSAAAMLILGSVDLVWTTIRSHRAFARWVGVAVAVACASWLLYLALLQRMPLVDLIARVIGNEETGLLSRYNTRTGVVSGAIAYVRLHPFAPIGLANVAGGSVPLAGQILGDSGVVTYLLRGGLVLLAAVYGGLWVFLRGTVRNKRVAVWLWGVTLAFELGFSSLLVPRVLALIMLTAMCLGDIYAGDRETTLTRSGVPYRLRQHDDSAIERYPR
jgi:hypothetical protein